MKPALQLVKDTSAPDEAKGPGPSCGPDVGELCLLAALFVLNLLPVAGELAGMGRWSPAVVGFAAGALLLTGRELWSQLRARARAKTHHGGES